MKKVSNFIVLFLLSFNMFAQSALGDGAIITRPVIDDNGRPVPFYNHFGVMWQGKVSNWDQNGHHLITLEEFAKKQTVKVLSPGLTGKDLQNFKTRYKNTVELYKQGKYDAVKNNCEHFAMEMVYGVKRSLQSETTIEMSKIYWTEMKKTILVKNPGAKSYIDMMDVYFQNQMKNYTGEIK